MHLPAGPQVLTDLTVSCLSLLVDRLQGSEEKVNDSSGLMADELMLGWSFPLIIEFALSGIGPFVALIRMGGIGGGLNFGPPFPNI